MTKQLFYLSYRIFIMQIRWNDFFTSCFFLFTCSIIQGCSAPLGMQNGKIPDAQITASSIVHHICQPHFGRLHRQPTNTYDNAWCPQVDNLIGGFLQIDLGSIKWVTKIATQGREVPSMWVTGYTLSFSNTTDTWEDYRGDQNCITVRTKQKRNVCVFIP